METELPAISWISNIMHRRTDREVAVKVEIFPSNCGQYYDIVYSHLPRDLENGKNWASDSCSFGYDLEEAISMAKSFLDIMEGAYEILPSD